ncbi:hypothetical protein C0J52_01683 [Blattella germanica]|nr:hypothetical protein C0J52_01683 [Blattella germanica]
MASVSDIRHKQRAMIEFLVAEKETVGNIHNICAKSMEHLQSIGVPLVAGHGGWQHQREVLQSSKISLSRENH